MIHLVVDDMGRPGYSEWVRVLIIVALYWGSGFTWARGPSIEDVPEYMEPEGCPFLFFRSQGKISVRKCDPKEIAPTEDSCKGESGSVDFVVGEKEFVDILESLVLLEEGNYTPEMREMIGVYRRNREGGIRKAAIKIAKVKQSKNIVTSPESIISLLDRVLEGERYCSSEAKLPPTGTNSSSLSVGRAREAVGEIEKKIRYLVEGISSTGRLMYVFPAENNRNFDYNLLKSYLGLFVRTSLSCK